MQLPCASPSSSAPGPWPCPLQSRWRRLAALAGCKKGFITLLAISFVQGVHKQLLHHCGLWLSQPHGQVQASGQQGSACAQLQRGCPLTLRKEAS